ncbi:MAG: OmpH family outer membrane protein [Balneolaceae bacterium]|nr:OmpH family outer membrane protein [Balneolaceae bacterium]
MYTGKGTYTKITGKLFLAGLMLIGVFAESALAQNQKIGFIDSDVILQRMPEYSGIEQRLSMLSDTWDLEIAELERELEELETEFEAREILFTDEIREQRLEEINQKRMELDRTIEQKFGPEGEYFTRQKELLEPIQRQIFEALTLVANREQFDFVFDRSQDTRFLFVRQQWNLTEEVMLELGIELAGN